MQVSAQVYAPTTLPLWNYNKLDGPQELYRLHRKVKVFSSLYSHYSDWARRVLPKWNFGGKICVEILTEITDGIWNEIAKNMKFQMQECAFVTAPTNGCKRYFTGDFTCLSAPDIHLAT
jgi:hypothetical protein